MSKEAPNCSSSNNVAPSNIIDLCSSLQKSFSEDPTTSCPQKNSVLNKDTTTCSFIKPGKFKYKSKLKESPIKLKKITFKKKIGDKTLANSFKGLKFTENNLNAVAQQLESLSMKPSEAPNTKKSEKLNDESKNLKIDHGIDYEMLDLNSLMSNCLHIPKQMSAMASAMYG